MVQITGDNENGMVVAMGGVFRKKPVRMKKREKLTRTYAQFRHTR